MKKLQSEENLIFFIISFHQHFQNNDGNSRAAAHYHQHFQNTGGNFHNHIIIIHDEYTCHNHDVDSRAATHNHQYLQNTDGHGFIIACRQAHFIQSILA